MEEHFLLFFDIKILINNTRKNCKKYKKIQKLLINSIEKKSNIIYNEIKKRKEEKMKKLKKILGSILIIAYAIIAVSVTVLLLSYNKYHCSEIGGYTFIIMHDDGLEPNFNKGDLILVKKTRAKNINVGDNIFLYRNITKTQFEIKYAEVKDKQDSEFDKNVKYILDGNTMISHEDVIGTTKDIKVIPNLGTVLSILESRYGYLFLIVVVTFVAFLYEIYELIMEIKYGEMIEEDKKTKATSKK